MLIATFVLLLSLAFPCVHSFSYSTAPPIWLTSPYFKAGNYRLVTSYQNVSGTNQVLFRSYPFLFSGGGFASVPSLAYGIRGYSAGDMLQHEHAQITTISLTATSFDVNVTLVAPLRIWYLAVAYIAVDPAFPHHFNSFNSVPINYPNIPLTVINANLTVPSKSFNNTIDYTLQAAGRTYSTFASAPSSYRVVIILTSFDIQMYGPNTVRMPNLWFKVDGGVINSTHYYLALSTNGPLMMNIAAFSLIIYNYDQIANSQRYEVFYQIKMFNGTYDNYYAFPYQFIDNFIMALTYFTGVSNLCSLNYIQEFYSNATFNGAIIYKAVVVNSTTPVDGPTNSHTASILYIRTWLCPTGFDFYNLTTQLCQSNCSNYYYGNMTNLQCQPCFPTCMECIDASVTNCLNCDITLMLELVNGSCLCVWGYQLNATMQCALPVCAIGCSNCTDNVTCYVCDSNYFIDINDSICYACIPHCVSCIDNITCDICQVKYFIGVSGCEPCIPNCDNCTDNATCVTCSSNFDYDPLGLCFCNNSNSFFLNFTSQSCSVCNSFISFCALCLQAANGSITCGACQIGSYNSGLSVCVACPYGCANCTNGVTCLNCSATYTLNSSGVCVCYEPFFFWDDSLGICAACNDTGCTLCFNLTNCAACNTSLNYFINSLTLLCDPCVAVGCLVCSSTTTCSICDSVGGYGPNPSNITECLPCNQTCTCGHFFFPKVNGTCDDSLFCGDGYVGFYQECDDGNNADNDGCSSTCQVQQYYTCLGQPSVCNLNLTFTITFLAAQKDTTICNGVNMQFSISPILPLMDTYDFSSLVTSPCLTLTSSAYADGVIRYSFNYSASLQGVSNILLFSFNTLSPKATFLGTSVSVWSGATTNNLPLIYSDAAICASVASSSTFFSVMEYGSYTMLLISALPGKIIGLELFGVLQFAYLILADVEEVNLLLSPLMGMKALQGMNLPLQMSNSPVPDAVSAIGYSSSFLDNCNLMLLLIAVEIAIALSLYLVGRLINSQKVSSLSSRMLKEGLVTLILFNSFNLAFSAALHFSYSSSEDNHYTLSTVTAVLSLLLLFAICVFLQSSQATQFGEFKDKFKDDTVSRLYIAATLLYRVILGTLTAAMNQSVLASLMLLGVSLMFLLYNLVNLPYRKAYHNYRANVCHFAHFVTIFVALYYRAISTSKPLQFSLLFSPAKVEIAALGLTFCASALVLAYDTYLFAKRAFTHGRDGIELQRDMTQCVEADQSGVKNGGYLFSDQME